MWPQATAAAIGALQLEDIEEQRGLFDGEEAVSEGERDAHGARLSELQRAACRRRTSMHQVVYRSCVSRVLRCPCHPCVHAILCPCHPCVHVIPVSMPSLCPCHSIAYVGSKPAYPPGPAFLHGAWQVASFSPVGVVRAVARRSVLRVDDCYGWPTGAHHNRAASSRWEA